MRSEEFECIGVDVSLICANRQSYIIKNRGHPRVNIRLFLQTCKGGRIVFMTTLLRI